MAETTSVPRSQSYTLLFAVEDCAAGTCSPSVAMLLVLKMLNNRPARGATAELISFLSGCLAGGAETTESSPGNGIAPPPMSTASGPLGLISEQLHNAIKTTASDADFITTYCCAGHGVPGIAARAIRDRHHDADGGRPNETPPHRRAALSCRHQTIWRRPAACDLNSPSDFPIAAAKRTSLRGPMTPPSEARAELQGACAGDLRPPRPQPPRHRVGMEAAENESSE
jgi:hypothetical protein